MIHVSEPYIVGNEAAYVAEAIAKKQIANGDFVERFESAFATYTGKKYAVSCSSGTAALHLALLAADVKPKERVRMPVLTYVATANAVRYCGAEPSFADVDEKTWNVPPQVALPYFPSAVLWHTRVVLPVALYGYRPKPQANAFVIEDASEALGAKGPWNADLTTFSFYGNKLITTGEGGMIVTDSPWLDRQLRMYRGQGTLPGLSKYDHQVVGYNYRMSNLAAAFGLAQLETIEEHLAKRWKVIDYYQSGVKSWTKQGWTSRQRPDAPWMYTMLLPDMIADRDGVIRRMAKEGIETRPTFVPLHRLPMYRSTQSFPVAERVGDYGLCLPTHANLTEEHLVSVRRALDRSL